MKEKEFLTRSELEYAGEAICNDQLVNFFEKEEHKHCLCSSVYYKKF